VRVKTLASEVSDAHFENIEARIISAIEETGRWYMKADSKDPRLDNLSGCILSRFQPNTEDYNWHIITSEPVSLNTKSKRFVLGHQLKLKDPKSFPNPLTEIKVGYYLRARVTVLHPKKGARDFDVTVFH